MRLQRLAIDHNAHLLRYVDPSLALLPITRPDEDAPSATNQTPEWDSPPTSRWLTRVNVRRLDPQNASTGLKHAAPCKCTSRLAHRGWTRGASHTGSSR